MRSRESPHRLARSLLISIGAIELDFDLMMKACVNWLRESFVVEIVSYLVYVYVFLYSIETIFFF